MSSAKQNRFLIIYFSVLGVGALALGYLAWSASSKADEAETNYQNKLTDLDRLEREPLSRTKENADKKKQMVEAYVAQVKESNNLLLTYQAPINPSESNTSFQNKLNDATKTVRQNAADKQVKLGDKFDLGMGKYLSEFPVAGSAPRLSAQLDAIVFLANAAMDAGVTQVDSLTRVELPFEKAAAEAPAPTPGTRPARPAPRPATASKGTTKAPAAPALDEDKVLERQPVSMTVTGKNKSILALLEALANASPEKMAPHFVIIRTLRVENEKKDGIPKNQTVTAEEVQEDPNDKNSVYVRDALFLLGNEQVKMQLDLDILRFVPEPAAPEKPSSTKPTAATASSPK